jgi:formylglycine-generating enzyme
VKTIIVFTILFIVLPGFSYATDSNMEIPVTDKPYSSENLSLKGDDGNIESGSENKRYRSALRKLPEELDTPLDFNYEALRKEFKDPITGMKFVFIKGGCYLMGDIFDDGEPDEKPVHEVCIDDFWMGKYEVTQRQWKTIMGNNPSHFADCGDTCPVEKVSWNDAQEFIRKFNQRAIKNYRMPTEAEWEYGARSEGRRDKFAGTNEDSELKDYAWCIDNADNKIHPVGQKKPNALGLFDMSGNVWEWVQDCYGSDYYNNSSRKNPLGPGSGKYHVLRGGSWYGEPLYSRASARFRYEPSSQLIYSGVRLAFSLLQ